MLILLAGTRLQTQSRASAFSYDIWDLFSLSSEQVGRRVLRHSCVTYRTVSALHWPSDERDPIWISFPSHATRVYRCAWFNAR